MIQRLGSSSLSFKANESSSVRTLYSDKINSNTKIAQKQNEIVSKALSSIGNNQIAMQGNNGQKLDTIA